MDTSVSPDARGKDVGPVDDVDRISSLPDHVLLLILRDISFEEAVRTSVLSKRWENVWKQLPHVTLEMCAFEKFNKGSLASRSKLIAELITKVVRNLYGNLDGFVTIHFSRKSEDNIWIQTLIHVKHTGFLILVNPLYHHPRARNLRLLPGTFSHPTLTTLRLCGYDLETPRAFKNCFNLIILKLENICTEIRVCNKIIALCPSLRMLELYITWCSPWGCLKIHNNNLRLLNLDCTYITNVEISANLLDIFSMASPIAIKDDNVFLTVPRLLQFKHINRTDVTISHLSYNISCNAQEEENIGHGFVVSKTLNYLKRYTSLSVSVDLMDPRKVEKLNEVLLAWDTRREELEIVFKDNNVRKEEGVCLVVQSQKTKKEEKILPLNDDFRVDVVYMYNFNGSNEKIVSLASNFVTQGVVVKKLKIKTSLNFGIKKLEMETAVAELMKLPKGNKELSIECF